MLVSVLPLPSLTVNAVLSTPAMVLPEPSLTEIPSLPITVEPFVPLVPSFTVMLVKFKSLLKANATLLPVLVAVRLISAGVATPISTVSPALIAPLFLPLVCKLKPPFKVVMSDVLVAIFDVLVAMSLLF